MRAGNRFNLNSTKLQSKIRRPKTNKSRSRKILTKNSNFKHRIKAHNLNGSPKSYLNHSKCSKFNLTVNRISKLKTRRNSRHSTIKKCPLMSVDSSITTVVNPRKDMINFKHTTTMAMKKTTILNSNKNWKSKRVARKLHLWVTTLIRNETVVAERNLRTIKHKKLTVASKRIIDSNTLKETEREMEETSISNKIKVIGVIIKQEESLKDLTLNNNCPNKIMETTNARTRSS
jgi:hypothetical protein